LQTTNHQSTQHWNWHSVSSGSHTWPNLLSPKQPPKLTSKPILSRFCSFLAQCHKTTFVLYKIYYNFA
jgi:hypothetical protein